MTLPEGRVCCQCGRWSWPIDDVSCPGRPCTKSHRHSVRADCNEKECDHKRCKECKIEKL